MHNAPTKHSVDGDNVKYDCGIIRLRRKSDDRSYRSSVKVSTVDEAGADTKANSTKNKKETQLLL